MSDTSQVDARRLIARLGAGPELGPCRGFLSTTYEFQPEFFETDFMPALFGLGSWNNYHWSSRIALERNLLGTTSALFMDSDAYRTRPRSLRVEILPGRGLQGRKLHAKVSLFRHDLGVRLVLGSANVTTPGYRSNIEVAAVLEATEKSFAEAAVMLQGLESSREVLTPWLDRAGRALLDECCDWLRKQAAKAKPGGNEDAICWGGGTRPLWEQVVERWPAGDTIHTIRIVSPFWSSEEKGSGPLFRLVRALRDRGVAAEKVQVELITAAHPATATTWRPVLPASLGSADYPSIGVEAVAFPVDPRVPAEEIQVEGFEGKRDLHAKVVLFEGQAHTLACLGSANFTNRGWGFDPVRSNIEATLVMVRAGKERQPLRALMPKTAGTGVPLGRTAADALEKPAAIQPPPPWPHFMADIRLSPAPGNTARLGLFIRVQTGPLPAEWSVLAGAQPLWSSTDSSPSDGPIFCSLSDDALGVLLKEQEVTVSWSECPGGVAYPINVAQDAKDLLPISPDSAGPNEEMLLSYYQGRVMFEDLFPPDDEAGGASGGGGEATPSSEVDTSRIQSYQIREFVESLAGIRADLQQAASSERAMRIALLGPVSPAALARLVRDQVRKGLRSSTGGAFQLVEIGQCIHALSAHPKASDWKCHADEALRQIGGLLTEIKATDPELRRGRFRKYETLFGGGEAS